MKYSETNERATDIVETLAPKKRFRADVGLLIFICVLVLLTLTTVTFLKYGSEQVLTGEAAIAEEELNGATVYSVEADWLEPSKAFRSAEGVNYDDMSSQELAQNGLNESMLFSVAEEVFDYAISFEHDKETDLITCEYLAHDENGQILFDSLGDPIVLHYSEYWQPGSVCGAEFNMDEAMGLTDNDTPEEAFEKAADFAFNGAYAANTYTYAPGVTSTFARNTQYTIVTGLSASASGSGGNGSGCSCQTYCYVSITGQQWVRWFNNSCIQGRCTYSAGGSGSSGYSRTVWIGWAGGANYGNDSGTGWRNRSGSSCMLWCCVRGTSNSTGSCSGSSVSASVSSVAFYLQHTNAQNFTVSTASWTKSWSTQRDTNNVTIALTSPIDFMRYFYLAYSVSVSGDDWRYSTSTSSDNYFSWNRATATRKNNTAAVRSNVYWYGDTQAGDSASRTYTGVEMYIDNYAPEGAGGFWIATESGGGGSVQGSSSQSAAVFVPNSSNNPSIPNSQSLTKTSTLYMFSAARDIAQWSNHSGASGVASVYAINNQYSNYQVTFTKIWQYSGDFYWWRGSLQAQYANGYWTVYIKDAVGNTTTYTSFWCSSIDCAAPVYQNNFTIDYNTTKSNAGSYWTVDNGAESYKWSSAPLYCYMSFTDQTGCLVTNGNVYKRNGFNYAVMQFFFNGQTYRLSSTSASGGNVNISNYVGMSDRNEGQWGTVTRTCYLYFYLPYDVRNIWTDSGKKTAGFTMTVYDYSGHYTTATINTQANAVRIDTVAPQVTAATLSAGKASNSYTSGNPTLTITVQDYSNASSNISGFAYCSNGSGVHKVYVYNVNPQSNRSAAPLYDLTTSLAASAAGNTSSTSVSVTIQLDARNISGSNGADPGLWIVAVDWAGNRSDAYNGYNANSSYSKNTSQNGVNYKAIQAPYAGAAYTWTNYYKSINSVATTNKEYITVWRDTYTPIIRVFTNSGCTAASCIASSDATNSTSATYAFEWRSVSSVTLYIQVVCGSSGGKIKRNNSDITNGTVAHYRTNGRTYAGSPAYATCATVTLTISNPGEVANTLYFAGNSGKNSATLNITTRLDQSLPEATLLGFSNGSRSASNINDAYNNTEANLTSTWANRSYYAVFKVTDTYSGLTPDSTTKVSYGKNGTALQQTTKCIYTITFWYEYTDTSGKTHKYTYTKTGNMNYFGSTYYVQIPMFNILDIQNLSNSGNSGSRTFLQGGKWDVTPGTYLHYTLKVKDFIGNENTFKTKQGKATKDANGYTTDMAYMVDPFPVDGVVNTYTVASSTDWNSMYNAKAFDSSKATGYAGAWTKAYVLLRVTLTPSISSTTSSFGYHNGSAFTYSNVSSVGVNANPYIISSNKEEWFYFSPGTRNVTASINIKNAAGSFKEIQARQPVGSETQVGEIRIRQDTTAPVLISAFLSGNSNIVSLDDANIALYFDYSGGNFYLNKTKSHNYNETQGYIWAETKYYLYLVVTDCINGLNGSGVCQSNLSETGSGSVKAVYYNRTYSGSSDKVGTLSSTTDRQVTRSQVGATSAYQYLYRSSNASTPYYGYVTLGENWKSNITITDHLGNYTSINSKLGDKSVAGTNPVTSQTVKAHTMFPFVDAVNPTITLTGTDNIKFSNGTTTYNSASYTCDYDGKKKLTGTKWDADGNAETDASGIIRFYTKAGTIKINLSAVCGISGYSIYLRRREFNKKLASEPTATYTRLTADTQGAKLPSSYDFIKEGWGYYASASTPTWTLSSTSRATYTPDPTLSRIDKQTPSLYVYGNNSNTVSNRFDALIVSGTGKYYLLELGDVVMDQAPPVVYGNLTFFTKDKGTADGTNKVVDFSNLNNRIWSNTVDGGYTNGKVYVYAHVDDAGVGVKDSTVKMGGQVMEKVTVNNVPVVSVGSKPTKILWLSDLYQSVSTAASAVNGYYAVTITLKSGLAADKKPAGFGSGTTKSFVTDIIYGTLSSTTASNTTTSLTYYRYLASGSGDLSVSASDLLDEAVKSSNSPTYIPNIDANDVGLTVSMTYEVLNDNDVVTGTAEYAGKKNNGEEVFVRSKVNVSVTTTYGSSGYGYLKLQVADKWQNSATRNYDLYSPKIESNGGKVKITYYNSSGTLTTETLSGISYNSSKNTLAVSVSSNKKYWKINGTATSILINETKYAAMTALTDTSMEIASGNTVFKFSVSKTNCKNEYKYTFRNGVTDDFKSSLTPTKANPDDLNHKPAKITTDNTKYIYMDTEKPVINKNSGTWNIIANADSYSALPKLLSVGITDNFGLGMEDQGKIENVSIKYTYYDTALGENKTDTYWMIKNFKYAGETASDGLFRPVDAWYNNATGVKDYVVDGFIYCDKNVEYTVIAYDKAGNKAVEKFTPKVDTTEAKLTELNAYVPDGNNWKAYTDNTWTPNKVRLVGTATFGISGYTLQYRLSGGVWNTLYKREWMSYTDVNGKVVLEGTMQDLCSALGVTYRSSTSAEMNATKTAVENKISEQWASLGGVGSFSQARKLFTPEGYVITSSRAATETREGYIDFYIDVAERDNELAYYQKYELRVLSKAQAYEIDAGGVVSQDERKVSVKRDTFVEYIAAERKYVETDTPTKDGGYYIISNLDHDVRLDASRYYNICIDKVTPVIGGEVNSDSAAYGSLTNATTWTCDTKYVNGAISITIRSTQNAQTASYNYASGNTFYFTRNTNAEITDYAEWTQLKPSGVIAGYKNGGYTNTLPALDSTVLSITSRTQAVTKTTYADSFTYTLNTSQQNTGFKFYIVSGAGLKSEMFTVRNIKLDTNLPTLSVIAVDSYQEFNKSGGKYFMTEDSSVFENAIYSVKTYNVERNISWTKKNSVVLKVSIGNVGYSGAKLYVKAQDKVGSGYNESAAAVEYLSFSYEEFQAKKQQSTGFMVVYIAVGENGDRRLVMYVEENAVNNKTDAHKKCDDVNATVRIDNTTPFVSVKAITCEAPSGGSGKAANWEYAETGDKWYVETLKITLMAGVIEKVGGVYVYKNISPYSGYKVYYCLESYINANGVRVTSSTWNEITLSGSDARNRILSVSGLYESASYKFKIMSNAGMEYVIGEVIRDNTVERNQIRSVAYDNKALTESSLQTALNTITGHNIDGEDYADFGYVFNIDTNRYQYSYAARLCTKWAEEEEDREYNNNTLEFVDYVVKKGDWSNALGGVFTPVDVNVQQVFRHGDILRVEFTSKDYSVDGFGSRFAYYHDQTEVRHVRTDFDNGSSSVVDSLTEIKVNDENRTTPGRGETLKEQGGYFSVTFGRYNINIVADFGAEVPVTYGETTFSIQNNLSDTIPTISTKYSWRDSGSHSVTPVLSYEYYVLELDEGGNHVYTKTVPTNTMNNANITFDVGAYYIVPMVSLYDLYESYQVGAPMKDNIYVYTYEKTRDTEFVAGKRYYKMVGGVLTWLSNYTVGAGIDESDEIYVADYRKTTDATFMYGKTYYVRNSMGNFRVAIMQSGAQEERKEFIVKYYKENDPNYYYIDNMVDFSYIEKEYYDFDPSNAGKVKKYSYLKDTGGKKYSLRTDLTLVSNTFKGFDGTFEAGFNGNEHTITLRPNRLTTGYGIFNDFSGEIFNLNIVADGVVDIYLSGSEEIDVGLLARTVSGGKIYNVSVSADISVRGTTTVPSYIGGIAAKADSATIGENNDTKAVYTDIRITNNGQTLRNAVIGGMFGSVDGTVFTKAIAFGDITVYNATSTYVGIVAAKGSIGNASGLYYFRNNTFLNDAAISTPGSQFNNTYGYGLGYDRFILTDTDEDNPVVVGYITVVGQSISTRILNRLYLDFAFEQSGGYAYGLGTKSEPLQISTVAHLTEIESYVNLNYLIVNDIDVSTYRPVAVHKIFNGVLNGYVAGKEYSTLRNFGNMIEEYGDMYFGFFGQLNGTVENIVFTDMDIDVRYTGSSTFHAGIVAGKTGSSANINNIIVVGITSFSSEGTVYAGGVIGSGVGSTMYDIMSINNVSVTASVIKIGGIIGKSGTADDAILLARDRGTVYSLGRVEARSASGSARVEAGAILGEGDIKSYVISPTVYGILDNTYILGVVASDTAIGSGNGSNARISMVTFSDDTMRTTSFSNGKSAFSLLFESNYQWYPLTGAGLSNNPFSVASEADFNKINLALFAFYKITADIRFTNFKTIGEGLNFTGTIDGSGDENISAEQSGIVSLTNVTQPLVYNVMGTIQNISLTVNYHKVVAAEETLYYGAVAVKLMEGGNIKNITIDGQITITGEDNSTTAYVSGFVAIVSGGTIDNSLISDESKLRNNISALTINISHIGTLFVGGYAASVERGGALFSFGIANGNITIEDCPKNNLVVGFLVGQSYGECSWDLSLSSSYFYNITVIYVESGVRIEEILEKPDDDDENDRRNLIGREN